MPNRAAMFMILYAVAMVLLGVLAYLLAPAGAASLTALIIPSACALLMLVCAIMSWRIASNRTMGMVGIHLGLVLPLLFAGAFFMTGGSRFMNAGTYRAALDAVESAAEHVPADAPAPAAFYFQTNAERAEQFKAQAAENTKRSEAIVAEAQTRRDRVNALIDAAVTERGVALTDTQRRHAEAALALVVGDRGRFPANDQAYLGRILIALFAVSLAFFVAILSQRGSAASARPVAKRASGKTASAGHEAPVSPAPESDPIDLESPRDFEADTGDTGSDHDSHPRA